MAEKPFSCPVADCNMTFANEDHLTVHKKKHELCLTLTPTTAAYKTFFADQTPTPTRFLNEILQDFQNDNPFEATFRKANSSNGAAHNFVIPDSTSLISSLPDSEVLNTPSITLPSEPATPITLKPNFRKKVLGKDNLTNCENTDSLPFTPNEQSSDISQPVEKHTICDENVNFLSVSPEGISVFTENDTPSIQKTVSRSTVVQTPVITSIGNSTVLKANSIGVPTAVVVTHSSATSVPSLTQSQLSSVCDDSAHVKVATEPVQPVVQSVCVTPMVQLMIRLPDGQTMPVQIPMMASAPTSTAQPAQTIASIVPQINTTTASTAKMKLKEIINLNQKSGNKKNSPNGKSQSRHQVQILPDSLDSYSLSLSPPLSPTPPLRPGHNGRKRRDFSNDPDEKRKRSLERNRAAATRCREKRKQWITNLERKADELAQTNVQLQQEVTQLRNEVAQLKTMLLAHKDCPVTLQQKASSYDSEKENFTTIRIITCSSAPDDVQRVPNGTNISPLNAEFMEMEVNSVQSSSDASFTSDASETSYRER